MSMKNLCATSMVALCVATLIGCASAQPQPAPAMAQKMAPGEYEATLSGSRKAQITIGDDMSYVYVEDSPRNGLIRQVTRKGFLRFDNWRIARAGRIKLEWLSMNSIKVTSPFGSTIGHGNNEGNLAYSSGPMITGMPQHVFHANRVGSAPQN